MINRDGIKKLLQFGLFALIVVVVFGYAYFSFRDYISGPKIIVTYPENGMTLASSTVRVIGQAIHIQEVTLNNRPILIDTKGNFKEVLLLSPGYNVSLFKAKDKFNRTIEYKLELVYQDKN